MLFKLINTYLGQVSVRYTSEEPGIHAVAIEIWMQDARAPLEDPQLHRKEFPFRTIDNAAAFIAGYEKPQAMAYIRSIQAASKPRTVEGWEIVQRKLAVLMAEREARARRNQT